KPEPAPMVRPDPKPEPAPMVRPDPKPEPAPMVRPDPKPEPAPMVRPDPKPEPVPEPAPMVRPDPVPAPAPEPVAVAEPSGPVTCTDLKALEPAAMLGRLSAEQSACLESSLQTSALQTDKKKISLLMMQNAWSKSDKKTWETLVKRHLAEIDQSDPDLCYKYAQVLYKMGSSRATGVIRWADVALENKTRWSGQTYTSRVYNLYKLRAGAQNKIWMAAEDAHTKAPSAESDAKRSKARSKTKVMAREWYDYAKGAGKDTTKALQLCVSAAATQEYCEGG
ncbi:MAG: hypothetical protein KC912_12415, partial [Proteobacteria bacterium]|nr:hypothetical protein [Pseudomonadota bacterium]